jgi:hypothetical protein
MEKIMKKIIIAICIAFIEYNSVSADAGIEVSDSVSTGDSLQSLQTVKADSAKADTTIAEDKKRDSLKKTVILTVRKDDDDDEDDDDTIDATVISKKLSNIRQSFSKSMSKSRAQGYGGGIMVSPIMAALSMKPVRELVRNDYTLRRYSFSDIDDSYKPMLLMGGSVYGGLGNGVRIGISGWGGEYEFTSSTNGDSAIFLNVSHSFGGFMIEKSFVKNNMNYLVGGTIGFGSLTVTKGVTGDPWKTISDEIDENKEEAKAPYSGVNLHTGFTVSVLPWMHIGTDVNGSFLFSVNGFDIPGCKGFMTVVPGLRFRITLGNIG